MAGKKYALIMEMPEDEELGLLPEDVRYELMVLETLYPSTPAIDTVVNHGKKLVYAVVTNNGVKDFKTFLESLIVTYDLDWVIAALQSWLSNAKAIDIEFPAEGESDTVFVTDVLVPFNKDVIFQYLPDRLDENDKPLDKQKRWMTRYQGQSAWE